MTYLEDSVRDALADKSWELPVPADPSAWVARRVARDRRRRAAVALPACAALVAVLVTAVSVGWGRHANRPQQLAAHAGEWTSQRDDLVMTVRLSDNAPAVGERVSGTLTVTNTGTQAVHYLADCGNFPALFLNYAMVGAAPAPVGDDPLAEFTRRVTVPSQPSTAVDFYAPVLESYRVRGGADAQCAPTSAPRVLAAGASTVRDVAWTVSSPNGTSVDASLPVQAVVSYLLPPAADGTAVQGDPTSRGSTTPSARSLKLAFTLALHGGSPDRPKIGDIVSSAAHDPAFEAVLRQQPISTWRFGWALTDDKPSTTEFGERDTDPMLTTATTWYVVLVYRDTAQTFRVTARVDGRTGKVIAVSRQPEAASR